MDGQRRGRVARSVGIRRRRNARYRHCPRNKRVEYDTTLVSYSSCTGGPIGRHGLRVVWLLSVFEGAKITNTSCTIWWSPHDTSAVDRYISHVPNIGHFSMRRFHKFFLLDLRESKKGLLEKRRWKPGVPKAGIGMTKTNRMHKSESEIT